MLHLGQQGDSEVGITARVTYAYLCSHQLAKHFLGILKGSQLTTIEGIN
jgi:hypothetical protein